MPLPKKLLVLDISASDASATLLLVEVTVFFSSARVLLNELLFIVVMEAFLLLFLSYRLIESRVGKAILNPFPCFPTY
jgi:hypothetical protein